MARLFLVAILFLFFHCNISSQTTDNREVTVLFVGNSYTFYNDLPELVESLSNSTDIKINAESSVTGGASLGTHWYEKRGVKTKSLIESGNYDIVILQDQSMRPINDPELTLSYGKLMADLIHSSGGKAYFFVTWARKNNSKSQSEINQTYAKAAEDSGATLIPIGPAWQYAQSLNSDINLFHLDGSHPSKLGTFLAAMVIVGSITEQLPLYSKALPVGKSDFNFFAKVANGIFD